MLRNVSETGRGKETAASCKHRDITTFFLEIISRGVSSDGDLTACMHVYPPPVKHTLHLQMNSEGIEKPFWGHMVR